MASVVEQSECINQLFLSFETIAGHKNELNRVFLEVFEEVNEFMNENVKVLSLHKELREKMLEWLKIYINLIEETSDEFGLLDTFTLWLVDLTAHQEVYDFDIKICVAPIEICVKRIKIAIQSMSPDFLSNYLDILASLFKLAKIQKSDSFQWFVSEIQKYSSLDDPNWPRLLNSILSVQHPSCQSFCKQFVPSFESLWMQLKSRESSRNVINSLAIVMGSCPFINNTDDRVKQILAFLLLPCFRDIQERVGTKWDTFRINGSQRVGIPEVFIDLGKFAPIIETSNAEETKLRAVQCVLQIEKKVGKCIQLVVEMTLAVFSKSVTDRISQCLPALVHFLSENLQYVNDFVSVLITKLCENHTSYKENTLHEMFRTLQTIICFASNSKHNCEKCNRNGFVEPDKKDNVKIDADQLTVLVKAMMDNKSSHSKKTISEFLQTCRVILIHVESKKLISAFTPIIKALDLGLYEHSNHYFRIWELISWKSGANIEKKLLIYVPLFARKFATFQNNSTKTLSRFIENVLKANILKEVKVTVFASLFGHAITRNTESNWSLVFNWNNEFASTIITDLVDATEEEQLQLMFKRYATIFTRSFVFRLFHETILSEGQKEIFDELKIRESARFLLAQVVIHFKFTNLISAINSIRPTLLYWSLVFGSRGSNPKHACSIIDFICQELSGARTASVPIVPVNPSDIRIVINQRKALITDFFPQLVQYSTFEANKKNDSIWKFCMDHCNFKEEDMKAVTCTYRKQVFEHILLVASQEFVEKQEKSAILIELQRTYESMKKGEKFSLSTAMDTRNEGIDFIFAFRTYFTSDSYFLMRESLATSFHIVLESLKNEFFEANWWTILMTLRQSPRNLEATRLSWISFIKRLDLCVLRVHIWRIWTDVSNVSNNSRIIEHLWERLYAKKIPKIPIDDMIKVYWYVPLELEKKFYHDATIATSRKVEDVFNFIQNFQKYPSLQFMNNLLSKIERGTIPKEDIPKLMGALAGIFPCCRSKNQQRQLMKVFEKVPITFSEYADQEFIRWDPHFKFFTEPRQLTQIVLEECAQIVENMSSTSKIEYADRTMCDIYKFFNDTDASEEMKSTIDGLKNMYAKMICSRKPDPVLIEQRTIDELTTSGTKPESFARWLTVIILKSAEMAENASLASLASIAHVDDTRFLSILAMRFTLTVIQMDRDSVTQWILTTFEDALINACQRRLTSSERGPAAFIFYVFDFLYLYSNSEEQKRNKEMREKSIQFWKNMMNWTTKDEYEHEQPLIVRVAEMFGMEKRCILWLEMYMDLMKMEQRTKGVASQESSTENKKTGVESAYYFTLMKLYARIHELNGVRGAYARLSRTQIDHVYGIICIREASGEFDSAASFARMTGKGEPFNATEAIEKLIDEQNSIEYTSNERKQQDEYVKSLKALTEWVKLDKDIGPSPHVFSRTIENRSAEAVILTLIRDGEEDSVIDNAIRKEKSKLIERLSECSLGGSCSYETASPFIAELQKLEEIRELKNASKEELIGFDSEFWKNLNKRTNDGEQSMSVIEPILRVRRSILNIRMNSMAEKEKDNIRSRIVDAHLQSARIARLTGCLERAQLSIINAKKVLPFENRIVLEEAKLRLQTSDELSGMSLLDSIITKNFAEIQTTYSHTQQSLNLDIQKSAKLRIEQFPVETKTLFSSVQMLRISHTIKSGNTVEFEKLFNEAKELIGLFASSGVMYEAVWYMDYLSNYNDRSKPVLALLKAYREVAKHEKNQVLQARAVERMTSLWLCSTKKINEHISTTKLSDGRISDKKQEILSMNREMQQSLKYIGWRAFYPAYAVLAQHIDHKNDEVQRTIKTLMKQLILRMPHQCMWQSVYLIRQNIAEIKEKYAEILAEVKRKSPCYVTLIDQYDYASGVFNSISSKVDSSDCKLSEKVEGLKCLFRDKQYDPRELEMNRRLDARCKVLNGIMIPIRSVIAESVHDPEVGDDQFEIKDEPDFERTCHLPDRYLIHDFSETVKVLHSNTKPVLIELTTMTGRKVRLICKKNDDLAKDFHFNKIVEMCNDLLMKDEQTRIQNMAATTYSVIPLAKHGGIIEFIEGVTPYYDTLDKIMQLKPNEWNQKLNKWKDEMGRIKSKEKRAEYFRDVACKETPVVMAKWFRLQYPEAGKWFACRKQFAKSTAVMSIIGYIFGLGDRHTKNLMVHLKTGKCIHVDFDMIFNKGETLGTPELVPFRLTQNMINGMGEVAFDGEFRVVCEQTLRVFRENAYEVEKYISDLPNLVADFSHSKTAPKDFDMTMAKGLVSGRIRGQIMTVLLHKSNSITYPMQVSQLASSLIDLATNDEKLCEMFPGWMPTL
uniref:non-specific serine/threonine protein kinase n=1 Tax=Caenorhabditis tropicalis TaxID=1561998 RepID=A0A1I7UBT1_9PELO